VQMGPEQSGRLSMIDVRMMSPLERANVLAWWFNHHLHCSKGGGHSWIRHSWDHESRAWLWGPCAKCRIYRLTQATGNYLEWGGEARYCQALVLNDDFGLIEKLASYVGASGV